MNVEIGLIITPGLMSSHLALSFLSAEGLRSLLLPRPVGSFLAGG